jgi:hypothetical protein
MNKDALPITPHEKQVLVGLLNHLTAWIAQVPTTTKCTDCRNYDCGFCQLAAEKIPDDVLTVGCEQWEFDPNSIPFD